MGALGGGADPPPLAPSF